jgi:anti-anti-sigma factor
MTVTTTWRSDLVVLTLRGELDLSASPALESEIELALSAGVSSVVCDLQHVTFIDPRGAAPLHRLAGCGAASGVAVYLVFPQRRVCRALELLGLAAWVVEVEALPSTVRSSLPMQ